MDEEIETCEEELEVPAHSLNTVGDAFPAFGIVAAVMGVVNALGSADRPAAELGMLIGHALVGTFLGSLSLMVLSYRWRHCCARRVLTGQNFAVH